MKILKKNPKFLTKHTVSIALQTTSTVVRPNNKDDSILNKPDDISMLEIKKKEIFGRWS